MEAAWATVRRIQHCLMANPQHCLVEDVDNLISLQREFEGIRPCPSIVEEIKVINNYNGPYFLHGSNTLLIYIHCPFHAFQKYCDWLDINAGWIKNN